MAQLRSHHKYGSLLVVAITLAVALLRVVGANLCDPHMGKCTCGVGNYESRQRYIVNCTNTGFTNTDVLLAMPNQTEVLIFTGNRIDVLPPNVIGSINDFPRLAVIDMSNNHIGEIRGKAYHHVASVELLILNHNNLSIAADPDDDFNRHHPRVFSNFFNLQSLHLTNAFADNTSASLSADLHDIFMNSNLTKLRKLHLEQNEIERFADPNVFCELPELRELYLADNRMATTSFNVGCIRRLHFLNLERNKFESVNASDLKQLDRLQALAGRDANLLVDWSQNPFVCDCRVQPFVKWLASTNVTMRNRDQLECKHRRKRVLALDGAGGGGGSGEGDDAEPERLFEFAPQCQLVSSRPTGGHEVALAVLLGAFSALLLVLIVSVVYMSRDRIRAWFTPMLSTVSKKVQYTTIRNEDQSPEVHV